MLVQVWSLSWSHASLSPLYWGLCKTCLSLQLRGDVIKSCLNSFAFSILQAIWAVILKGRFSVLPHHHTPHGVDPGWSWGARAPPPPRGVDPPPWSWGAVLQDACGRVGRRACVRLGCYGSRPMVEMQVPSYPLLLLLSVLFVLEGFLLFNLRNTLSYFFFLPKQYISLW